MVVGIARTASVFNNHEGKTQASTLARSGFNTEIGGDAREDDGSNATLAKGIL